MTYILKESVLLKETLDGYLNYGFGLHFFLRFIQQPFDPTPTHGLGIEGYKKDINRFLGREV